nr:sulfurtransferase [Paenibacillus senegalensis]
MPSHLISLQEVYRQLEKPDVIVVDCRFVLGNPDAGKEAYLQGHIPGAIYMDLEKDLSGPVQEHGGRHPLPDLGRLSILLGESGIDDSTRVFAYDDQGGAMASRFWWLLRFLGHNRVYLMDEGYTRWQENGFPVSRESAKPSAKTFVPRVQSHLLASMHDVREKLDDPETVLIDSREHTRYLGEAEPIDPVAGHIPGALNYFWKESLDEQNRWKSGSELSERFAKLAKDSEIIVYCGSGVTACPNVLALMESGFDKVKLYAGSWSDWISYPENPVAQGEE